VKGRVAGKTVRLLVDPQAETVVGVENDAGESIGQATPLDALANRDRRRRKPDPVDAVPVRSPSAGPNLVELVYQQYYGCQED
jgi:putative transposase